MSYSSWRSAVASGEAFGVTGLATASSARRAGAQARREIAANQAALNRDFIPLISYHPKYSVNPIIAIRSAERRTSPHSSAYDQAMMSRNINDTAASGQNTPCRPMLQSAR